MLPSPPVRRERSRSSPTYERTGLLVISLQVFHEYFVAATRKLGVAPEIAQQKIQVLTGAQMVRFEASDVIAAIELHRLNRISFWDAMIVHAVRVAGVDVIYSEDLQHAAILAGVRIDNPLLSV